MKCSTIQRENVNREHAATIIATNVQMASHSIDTSPGKSAFVSRLIDNCLLYARPDRTQMLLQLVFQKFQKSFKFHSVLCLFFCCKFFHSSVSSKSSNSCRFKNVIRCTDQFPWLAVWCRPRWHRNGNKVSWYPVLSKFISYLKTADSL